MRKKPSDELMRRLMPSLFDDVEVLDDDTPEIVVDSRGNTNKTQRLANQFDASVGTYEDTFDVVALMESALDPMTGVLRDANIDDRDFTLAKNYYDWCFGDGFLGRTANKPWVRQFIPMALLFGEICFNCTPRKYRNLKALPKDFATESLPEVITFLEYGVCPKCGENKASLYRNRQLEIYNEAVLCWGQRCVHASTLVPTSEGLVRIGDLDEGRPYGFTRVRKRISVHTGDMLKKPSKFFKGGAEYLFRVELADGGNVVATADHPLLTLHNGFVKVKDLKVGVHKVKVAIGTGCFGSIELEDPAAKVEQTFEEGAVPPDVFKATKASQRAYIAALTGNPHFEETFCILSKSALTPALFNDLYALLTNYGMRVTLRDELVYISECVEELTHEWVPVKSIKRTAKKYESYDFTVPVDHQFVTNGMVSHNSGKSETAASGCSYLAHRHLKIPNLASMTQAMQASTPLVGTFVSLTFETAMRLLWKPFWIKMQTSEWFVEYHKMLDYYGNKMGKELYQIKKEFISYGHRNLYFHASHPNGSTLRGATRIFSAIDELGLFPLPDPTKKKREDDMNERANADQAHRSIVNSMVTVQEAVLSLIFDKHLYHLPTTYVLGVSSPVSERDKVMRLLADSRTPEGKETILGSQMPTWEINPYIERDSDIIKTEYRRNPVDAERNFGAQPATTASPWYGKEAARRMFTGNPPILRIVHQYDVPKYVYGTLQNISGYCGLPSILTLDAGLVNNSFSLTISFRNSENRIEFPVILELFPHSDRNVHFNRMYKEVILPLAKACNVTFVSADRWNSADFLSRIVDDLGKLPNGDNYCKAKEYRLKPRDFDTFMQASQDGAIILPRLRKEDVELVEKGVPDYTAVMKDKPVAHTYLQFLTVQRFNPLDCPMKADGYTDDNLRAIVLGANRHMDLSLAQYMRDCIKTHTRGSNKGSSGCAPVVRSRGH